MYVVCYIRPWNNEYFTNVAKEAFPDAKIETISDFKNIDSLSFQKSIKKNYSRKDDCLHFSNSELEQIIHRCRLLRSLTYERSSKLINAVWLSLIDTFSQDKPDLIIGITVDSYVTDLIRIYSERNGIKYYGFVISFLKGYYRITQKGEYIKTYKPSIKEIENAFDKLYIKKEKPHYLSHSESNFRNFIKAIRNHSITIVKYPYFSFLRLFHDKLCYHYWSNQILAKESLKLNFSSLKACHEWKSKLSETSANIYIPLQFIPEATVDYWVKDIRYIDYYNVLFDLFRSSDNNVKWFVKEHPSVIGLRPGEFYKKLNNIENVVIVPSTVLSTDVISSTDITLVWTGTAGFEAALSGKPVIHLGEPFYISGDNFYYLSAVENINELVNKIPKDKITTDDQRREMIKHLLSGLLPGQFAHPKRVRGKWVSDNQPIPGIAKSLTEYYYANKS